jgi:hypothetical protein
MMVMPNVCVATGLWQKPVWVSLIPVEKKDTRCRSWGRLNTDKGAEIVCKRLPRGQFFGPLEVKLAPRG